MDRERSRSTLERIHRALPYLAVLYVVVGIQQLSSAGQILHPTLVTLMSLAVGLLLGATSILLAQVQSGRLSFLPAFVGSLVLAHCLTWVYATGQPQVAAVSAVMLISAAILLRTGWLVALWGALLGGWIYLLKDPLLAGQLSSALLYLTVAACVSIAEFFLHRWNHLGGYRKGKRSVLEDSAEKTLRSRFEFAYQATEDGFWYWDLKTNRFHVSASWAALIKVLPNALEGRPDDWFSRIHPSYLTDLRRRLQEFAEDPTARGQFRHQHRMRRSDSSYFWALVRATCQRNNAGVAIAMAGALSDITPLLNVEQRLLEDIFEDPLTGLANRHALMARLETAVTELRNGRIGGHFAVLFLDLNEFKKVNDTLGHLAGDQLLIAVAGRLRHCIGKSDIVSRFAGDEFVILLHNLRGPQDAYVAGLRVVETLGEPYEINGHELGSGASVGIALSSRPFKDAEDLIQMADSAMYRAKATKTTHVEIFEPGMRSKIMKAGQSPVSRSKSPA